MHGIAISTKCLERKVGIPITLSVVYMEIGKRIGLPLVGVGFPGHFIVKHRDLETVIDPFEKGQSFIR